MRKKIFTNEEILALSKNKYVKQVSEKGVTYIDEFKSLFIAEHSLGKLRVRIFKMLDLIQKYLVMIEGGLLVGDGEMLIKNLAN